MDSNHDQAEARFATKHVSEAVPVRLESRRKALRAENLPPTVERSGVCLELLRARTVQEGGSRRRVCWGEERRKDWKSEQLVRTVLYH